MRVRRVEFVLDCAVAVGGVHRHGTDIVCIGGGIVRLVVDVLKSVGSVQLSYKRSARGYNSCLLGVVRWNGYSGNGVLDCRESRVGVCQPSVDGACLCRCCVIAREGYVVNRALDCLVAVV